MVRGKVFLAILLAIAVFALAGCGSKTALTAEQFKSKMEAAGYEVQDATYQYEGLVDQCFIAVKGNFEYQIEFYVVATESQAVGAYNQNKEQFQSKKSNASAETTKEVSNYGKYTLNTGGNYSVISRVDNTFIYIDASNDYRDEINKTLDSLGY